MWLISRLLRCDEPAPILPNLRSIRFHNRGMGLAGSISGRDVRHPAANLRVEGSVEALSLHEQLLRMRLRGAVLVELLLPLASRALSLGEDARDRTATAIHGCFAGVGLRAERADMLRQ